ncbi:adenosylcobinamide-GDP ribazoletransferase [Candidatus Methanoprimaticola sp. MG2]|uniref:adenosylcobinamide-GDP ribazoletransferase n=1 Tax=Candidatus Methanoprimaticola sp. MG2 TaxID=3228838 RepID=UPI0039C608A1
MADGNALKAMVSFFTIWQQDLTQEDMDAMDREFHLVPVVGALMGLAVLVVAGLVFYLQMRGIVLSNMFMAIAVMATAYVGSRFLHFDGLADFGDGSVVAGTQEDHVRALKDTLIGAGALGVALVVTLINFSEYTMAGYLLVAFAPITEVLVKNAQVACAAFGMPGNGMAGRQVSETGVTSMWKSTGISLVLAILFSIVGVLVIGAICDLPVYIEDVVFAALFGLIASVVSGYLMARRSNRVFGMVNGDILGATNEISRAAIMLVMVVVFSMVM